MTTKNNSYFEKLESLYGKMTFGVFLSSWREANGVSQTAFAKTIGISTQNLNDIEKGRRVPSPARASKIAKKLGLPEIALIQLSIRDSLSNDGFNYDVKLSA